jgi:preprotein translocase subunit SecE
VSSGPANWIEDGRQYVAEVQAEFKKITWPSQREYVSGTIGVVIIVIFLAIVLGVIDFGLAELMELFFG